MNVSYNVKEELCIEHTPGAGAIVIFGASGDLTKRKLLPAIYSLFQRGLLSPKVAVVGVARTAMSHDEFREQVKASILGDREPSAEELAFIERFSYVSGQYTEPSTYVALREELERVATAHCTGGNALFYLAMPPELFEPIVRELHGAKLLEEVGSWSRVIIEKPFGHDLESAIALDESLKQYITEEQTYRIFEPLWNRKYIERVEITVAEELGVEKRAGYYDGAGALRDMVQNHMIQVLSLIAMEPPASFNADDYRDEIAKLISSIRGLHRQKLGDIAVRGQYTDSGNTERPAPEYRKEENVPPTSTTETYVALKLFIDNWRWRDVPFYLRTGKRLPKKSSEIAIIFKPIPHSIFKPFHAKDFNQNVLVLRMQPNEGMGLSLEVKSPGSKLSVNTLEMDFSYSNSKELADIPDAYERLILDGLLGDQTLFVRNDAVEKSWRLFKPLIEAWERNDEETPLCFYPAFSEGPKEAEELLEGGSWSWREI